MENITLLQYLSSSNPSLDCARSSTGTNTLNAKWDAVTGLEEWEEFNYETLTRTYGQILQQPISPVSVTYPPLSTLEKQIFTERTFETVLERSVMPEVSEALRVAWSRRHPPDDGEDIAEIGKGDKARRGTTEEDDRYYADWAGMRPSEMTSFGYKNLCPGETKLASKWSTSGVGRRRTDYLYPFNQVQTYCGRQWGSRYGYIITPEELVVIRVSKESVGPGLAALRSVRGMTRQTTSQELHSRTFSTETVRSELQALSLETGSAFSNDANPDIEYGPLMFMSVPWHAEGDGVLTVKLSLWWLHMLIENGVSIQDHYPPLESMNSPRGVPPVSYPPTTSTISDPTPDKRAAKKESKGAGRKKKG